MIQLQITLMLEEFMDRFLFKGEKKHSQNKTWKMFFIGEAMRIRGCVQTVKDSSLETSTVEVYELHAIITDFGLSRPVDLPRLHDQGNYELFHGTEILQGQKESLASDVYAFGIIMFRPKIPEGIPPLCSTFMQRCWDADPSKRPSSEEIHKTLCDWYNSRENTANEELRFPN
ncbi:hypothetical protein RhiirB3_525427 [Rhizophagus irregularis]|nr:hypothetical protein RhiirB3_525427 [Rhizophagus irregularis]